MTTPFTTYNKMPVQSFTVPRAEKDQRPVDVVGSDWLTRELGKVEGALRIPVAATGGYFTLTDPQWGGDNTGRRDNSPAMRKILALIASGLTTVRGIYAPGGTYVFADNFTLTGGDHDGVTIFGDGPSTVFQLADSPNTGNIEAGWMCILTGTVAAPLTNVLVTRILFDGNRSGTDWTDSSYGIVGYTDAVLEDCVVSECWAREFRSSGFATFTGGIRFLGVTGTNNTDHGIAVSVDTTFTGYCDIVGGWFSGNAGGIDAGRGCRTRVTACVTTDNTDQGFKYSLNTIFLSVNGLHTYANGVPGVGGAGFTETHNTGSAIVELDNIVTHDNAGYGFRCTNAGQLTIGSVLSYDNACFVASALGGADILLGSTGTLDYFSADSLVSRNSPTRGVLVDGVVNAYTIGYVEVQNAELAGFADLTTGPTYGVVRSALYVNCNQAGTAGASGAAHIVETTGSHKATGVTFKDTQGSPTQVSGFYFTSGIKAHIDGCMFGTGIGATGQVYSATAGTTVTFGSGNTGLVVRARGTYTSNGGTTAETVTYPTALTNLGGLVLFAQRSEASQDASGINWISAVSVTALTVTYAVATPGGSGNVSYRYDVQAEIQR